MINRILLKGFTGFANNSFLFVDGVNVLIGKMAQVRRMFSNAWHLLCSHATIFLQRRLLLKSSLNIYWQKI